MAWSIAIGWLFKDVRRLAFIALTIGFSVASLWAGYENKRYRVLLVQTEQQRQVYVAQIAQRDAHIQTYRQTEKVIAQQMRKQANELEAARNQSANALANLKRAQAKADRGVRAWAEVYKQRPEVCKAALESLEESCPSLSRY